LTLLLNFTAKPRAPVRLFLRLDVPPVSCLIEITHPLSAEDDTERLSLT
jgi:hypothetical protein